MNPQLKRSVKYSILTLLLYFVLIPIHEVSHLFMARIEDLPVESYSLLSLSPSVTLSARGSVWFFLSGPVVILVIVWSILIYSWKKPFRNYLIILLIVEIVAGFVDFGAAIRLILR